MTSERVNLQDVLTPNQVVMVSVAGSTSNETRLSDEKLGFVLGGCREGIALFEDRGKVRSCLFASCLLLLWRRRLQERCFAVCYA